VISVLTVGDTSPISEQYGFSVPTVPITIRNKAPDWLKDFVV
jgi:hypothetical protein